MNEPTYRLQFNGLHPIVISGNICVYYRQNRLHIPGKTPSALAKERKIPAMSKKNRTELPQLLVEQDVVAFSKAPFVPIQSPSGSHVSVEIMEGLSLLHQEDSSEQDESWDGKTPAFTPVPEGVLTPNDRDTSHDKIMAPSSLVGKRVANLIVREELGRGGFGAVYRAEQQYLKQSFALKVLHPTQHSQEMIDRFVREAKVLSQINHKHIVRFFDFGRFHSGDFYLVMEFVKGTSLRDFCLRENLMPLPRLMNIMEQICDALFFIHQQNLIHRDLKPENIMINVDKHGNEQIKLFDFGIAALSSGESDLTRSGIFMGTPQYASPEQVRGSRDLDARADLYSLGIMLYKMLTGVYPIDGDSAVDIAFSQINVVPPALYISATWKTWSPALEEFIQMTLDKDPDKRPSDAQQFWQKCSAALAQQKKYEQLGNDLTKGLPIQAVRRSQHAKGLAEVDHLKAPSHHPPPQQKPSMKSFYVSTAIALLSVVLLGGGVYGWLQIGPRKAKKKAPGKRVLQSKRKASGKRVLQSKRKASGKRVLQSKRKAPASILSPAKIKVKFQSNPTNALLFMNGQQRGWTPIVLQGAKNQSVQIRLSLKGHQVLTTTYTFLPGKQSSQTFKLQTIETVPKRKLVPRKRYRANRSQHVRLTLRTIPSGAQIWLNGKNVGRSPLRLQKRLGQLLRLRFRKKGYLAKKASHRVSRSQKVLTHKLVVDPF